jgi:hypothetical protein
MLFKGILRTLFNRKTALGAVIGLALSLSAVTVHRLWRGKALISIAGAVLRQDSDLSKQLPIANAQVFVGHASGDESDDDPRYDLSAGVATTDAAGQFRLKMRDDVYVGQLATVHVRHPDYLPLDIPEVLGDRLYVIRMAPVKSTDDSSLKATMVLSDIRVRYSTRSQISVDAGSATKTFQVVNKGDIPCDRHGPCSPDGKWKAAIGGASLDAGDNNTFHEARVTCIAGPCPFTKIEKDSFSGGGRSIGVTVRNWSDTTMFLIEAEVTHTTSGDEVLRGFPAIFDRAMSFTLPASAEGPSIEANLNGEDILFPLGPTLNLSWATCSVEPARNGTKIYHCLLKPGYRFR